MALVATTLSLVAGEVVLEPRPAAAATPYETAVLSRDPAAFWRFDHPSGTRTAFDSVGDADFGLWNNHNYFAPGRTGAIIGDPSLSLPNPHGMRLTTSLDPASDYWSDAYTVELWRYLDADADGGGGQFTLGTDIPFGPGAVLEMSFAGDHSLRVSVVDANEDTLILTSPVLTKEEWHHIVLTVSGARVDLYLDAAPVASGTMGASVVNGASVNAPMSIQMGNSGQDLFGALDEVAFYRRALRLGEVRANYAASGRTPPLLPPDDIDVPSPNELCPECNPGQRHLPVVHDADPVGMANGDLTESFTDLAVPGRGRPVTATRTYNSARADEAGLFGPGWSTPLDMVLRETAGYAEVTQENGAALPFSRSGSSYVPPARVTSTLAALPGGGWRLVRNKTDIVTFDAQGRVSGWEDQNGYVTTVSRAASSITVTTPGGRSIVWALGSDGLVTSVTDTADATRKAEYSYTDGRLTGVTSMKANATDTTPVSWGYAYDDTGLLESVTDPRGNSNLTVYDSDGRVDHQFDYAGARTDIDYGTSAGTTWTRVTDPAYDGSGTRSTTEYVFTDNIVTSMTTGWGTANARTWTYEYFTPSYFLKKITGPGGAVQAEYTYDAAGNILTAKDAAGRTTTFAGYDAFNNPGSVADPAGNVTSFVYDTFGNLEQTSVPVRPVGGAQEAVATTTYERTDATHPDDVTAIVAPDQQGQPTPKKTQFSYRSTDGQLEWVEDPEGNRTSFGYDSRGFVTSTVSPRGNATTTAGDYETTFTVNDFGMVQGVTDPLGEVSSQVYDGNGNVVSVTDANGQTTATEYDDMNRPRIVERADGSEVETTYFPNGAVRAQINGLGDGTTYTYDVHGAVSSVTDPNDQTTGYRYDSLGRLQHRIDPGGTCPSATGCTTYGYSPTTQELISVAYSDPATPDITGVTYDALGQRTAVTRSVGAAQTWAWDNLGRLRSSTDVNGRTTAYTWTLDGDLNTITYPGQTTPVDYAYDAAGRMTSMTDWAGRVTQFGWTADSQWQTTTFPAGTSNVDTRTYDEAGRLASVEWKRGSTSLGKLTYDRDPEGLLESETPTGGTFSTKTWGYDDIDQLDQVDTATLELDDAGNLTRTEDGTFQVFDPAQQLCWTSPTASGPCGSPAPDATTYDYDSRGNRTAKDAPGAMSWSYGYNQENRMTSAVGTGEAPISAMTGTAVAGDFDGDDSDDVFWYHPGSTQDWVSWGTDRSQFGLDATAYSVNNTSYEPFSGDFDGDGNDDIFWYAPGGGADSVWFWFNDGVDDYTTRFFTVNGTYTPIVGDFDGDSFSDVYWYGAGATAHTIWWGNSDVDGTSAFTSQAVSRPGNFEPIAGDFDNNGVDDIMWYEPGTGADSVSYGTGTRNSWIWRNHTINGTSWDLAVGDFDGDNKDDLFLYSSTASQIWWGAGVNDFGAAGPTSWVSLAAGYQLDGGDFDGDGHDDLLAYNPSGTDTVWWGSNTRASFGTAAHRGLTTDPSTATYSYDSGGLRNAKTVNGSTTQFTWDTAAGLPLLLSQHQGTTATQIVYGPGGTPLYEVTGSTVTYYHHDHQGSTRLTTSANGTAVARYAYDAYGALATNTAPSGGTPLLGYTAQYTDSETGYIYLRARYFDPSTGQFTTQDPERAATRSPYSYASADPVNMMDPTGRFAIAALLAAVVETIIIGALIAVGGYLVYKVTDKACEWLASQDGGGSGSENSDTGENEEDQAEAQEAADYAQGIAGHIADEDRTLNGVVPGTEEGYIKGVLSGLQPGVVSKEISGGKTIYYDPINGNIVVKNPKSDKGGTAFKKPGEAGWRYFDEEGN